MSHKEYSREVPDSDTAIVCIHGILGTPNHFKAFINEVPENWSIYNLLLPGHGGTVTEFAHTSMNEWKEYVNDKIEYVANTYKNIVIVAHSMGTLFAIQASIRYADKVKVMFLLGVPLAVRVKLVIIPRSLKVIWNCVSEEDVVTMAEKNAYSIEPNKRLWLYLRWIPRYLELFHEVRAMRKLISQVRTPCYVYQSQEDELVSMQSCNYLRENKSIKVSILKQSGHFYYEEAELKKIINEFRTILSLT